MHPCILMHIVGTAVEKEAHQDAKPSFPKGTEWLNLLRRLTRSYLIPVTLFQHYIRLIWAVKVILPLLIMKADSQHKFQSLLTTANHNQK